MTDNSGPKPLVGLVLGSESDLPVMKEARPVLDQFGIAHEITIASAHRSPQRASLYARQAAGRGLKVLIAGAGYAAHLAGVLAAETVLPVIGVPLSSSPLNGFDSLLSTVMMPPGVPVACVAIGGARNAALLAVRILAAGDPVLTAKLLAYQDGLARTVEEKAALLK